MTTPVHWVGDLLEGPGGGDRVVAEPLSGEEAPVGLEADLPQLGQVPQPFADREIPGVVDRGFGSDRSLELVVLLDLGVLVVDVDRRGDIGGEHAGAPPRRGGAPAAQADPAVEDQAGLVGPAQVEVVADQLLEEHPA